MKPKKPLKRLLLKLGTACNLGCPHCHQVQKNFTEHPGLIDWIKDQGFKRITFSGGEPLMYFDTIKRIMETLGKDVHYRMMSNGTLLTKEIAEFFKQYNVTYCVSYDGKCGGRDLTVPIQWHNLKYLGKRGTGICTIFSDPDFNFREFAKDVGSIMAEHGIDWWTYPDFLKVNWLHQTKDAPSEEFTQEVADRYIKQAKQQLDKVFYCFSIGELEGRVVENLIRKWYPRPRIKHGTACCNDLITNLNLDGTIMKCPYGTDVIGTIDNPPTNDVFDSFIPEKCKSCEFWEVCRCECVASVTGLDCYVNRTMIPYVRELIKKYDVEDKVKALFTQRNNKG